MMMLHGSSQSPSPMPLTIDAPPPPQPLRRKRPAESQDNERLSKRLSLLNLGMLPVVALSSLPCRHPCLVLAAVTIRR